MCTVLHCADPVGRVLPADSMCKGTVLWRAPVLESVFRDSVQDERGNMRMLRDRAGERLGKRGKDVLCAEVRNLGFILKTSEGFK